jgi:UDP-3-O-[3-hydroxymyristoyl] glucosamine N-acyltransferase
LSGKIYTLRELSELVRGELAGDGGVRISGVAGIKEAGEGDITVVADARYAEFLASTRASAVIRASDAACPLPSIVTDKPFLAFVKLLDLFAVSTDAEWKPGVHESALVDPSAVLGENVGIGPFCRIGRGARIGSGTRIVFGTFIGDRVVIGKDCLLYPNVTIREASEIGDRVIMHPGVVIGADGFGYVWDGERQVKVPQIGKVVIEDDVEIGANTTIDRATTAVTRICRGTKIDNLVQVGHNCVVGRHSILAGQVGLSGSAELGERVTAAGQAGIGGHIKVGDGAVIGGQGGVTKSIPPGMIVSGYPAKEHRLARKLLAYTSRLPELFERVKAAEAKIAELEKKDGHDETTENDR